MGAQQLAGLLLVAVGILLFIVLRLGVGADAVPLLIGAGLFVAYGLTRQYGFLIPAAIMTGLGTGIVIDATGGAEEAVVLGLGVGFIAIAVIDGIVHGRRPAQWWPLIPGGILSVVGFAILPSAASLARYLLPAAVIAAGLWLLASRPHTAEHDHRPATQGGTRPR
jgi:hypothetical protein